MQHRDSMRTWDILGGIGITVLVAVAVFGLFGFLVFDEGSETYGKLLGIGLGILVILAGAHFAIQGWQRLGSAFASMYSGTPGVSSSQGED